MADIDLFTAISALLGGFLGSAGTAWIGSISRSGQSWEQLRDDDMRDICKSVDQLKEMAERYWIHTPAELGEDERLLPAKIVSMQHHIPVLYAALFQGPSREACHDAFLKLMDAATGGDDMGDPGRLPQWERVTPINLTSLTFSHVVKMERRKLRRHLFA